MHLIRAGLISINREMATTNKVILSGVLFCMTCLFATQSHAVDYQGGLYGGLNGPVKKNEIQVENSSPNKIKVCAFNGNDKVLLIPHSKSKLGPGKNNMFGCEPDDTDTCKIRFVKPGDKCTDSSWPVINANIGNTLELRKWNGVSDSSFEIWSGKIKFTSYNGKVSSTNYASPQPATSTNKNTGGLLEYSNETKPRAVLHQVWIGKAPACAAQKSDCTSRGWTYVRSDKKGDGKKCLSGTKVLCEYYQ